MRRRLLLPLLPALLIFVHSTSLSQDLKSQALDHFKNESYSKAIETLKLALTQHPDDAELWFYLGWFTHYYSYDSVPFSGFTKAVSDSILVYLKKALSLDPTLRDAYSFLGSEYGARALHELQFKNVAGFLTELKMGGNAGSYPDWLLEYARNLLKSCDQDAILVTGGDAEAFSIWYCQFLEGFRRDITVIPFALLDRPWFVLLLKNGLADFVAPLPISWSQQQIIDMHPYKWKAQSVDTHGADSVAGTVWFYIKPDLMSDDREFLTPRRALLVDIMKTNRWRRPLQFTLGCPPFVTTGLDDYLQLVGLTRRLVPFVGKNKGRFIDVQLSMSLLGDEGNFRFFPTIKEQGIPRISNVLNNYRMLFLVLCDSLAQSGKLDQADFLLQRMESSLPHDALPVPEGFQKYLEQIRIRIRQAQSRK